MSELREWARTYAERGFRVLPCWPVRDGRCACGRPQCVKSAGKHPLSALVPRGVKDATNNLETIDRWWEQFPDANVAIATGEQSGTFVLDIDPKSGGTDAFKDLLERLGTGLPTTAVVRTPNQGSHFYMKHPGTPVKNSVSQLGPGLDIRGENGYVVAPPSRTVVGEYEWYSWGDMPLEQAPQAMVQAVTGGSGSQVDPLEFAELMSGVPEGRRDIILFRWACKLRSVGIPLALAQEIVSYGARKCEPPFSEDDARQKVERAYQAYPVEFELTDTGNAERLVYRHGQDLRYSVQGTWLVWDGTRWKMDYNNLFVVPYAQDTVKSIRAEGLELQGEGEGIAEKRAALIAHANRSAQVERIMAMLRLAQSDPGITVDPERLDADPWLLNLVNGTLDLRSGALYHHNQEDLITKVAGTAHNPEAVSPTWLAFLERVQPDPEVRAFLQRAAGYSLSGSVREQVMFFMHGTGKNGKSTFANAIMTMLGDYATQGTPDILLADKSDSHPTVLADLTGVRYVPTIEIDQGKKLAEAQFKWITGGDKLKARRMRQDYYEFKPTFKLWMAANHKPIVRGDDSAVWRRIHLIPFTVSIPPEERDGSLPEKLEAEMPGILNWALEGCLAWLRDGLNPPKAVLAATEEYRQEMDVLGQFLEECTEPSDSSEVSGDSLYVVYRNWAKAAGIFPMSKVAFTRRLRTQGVQERSLGSHKMAWRGFGLSDEGKRMRDMPVTGFAAQAPTIEVIDTATSFFTNGGKNAGN